MAAERCARAEIDDFGASPYVVLRRPGISSKMTA
jgi:hypothetical protein